MPSNSSLCVVGGTYREICLQPFWDHLFGSGVRGAAAISGYAKEECSKVELVTCIERANVHLLKTMCSSYDIELNHFDRDQAIEFQYDFPLGTPRLYPPLDQLNRISVPMIERECCLVFGAVDYEPHVRCKTLIYDPQSGKRSVPLNETQLHGQRTAIVANLTEVRSMAARLGSPSQLSGPAELGAFLRCQENVEVVVVKDGCAGATVVTATGSHSVPCFKTDSVFSIGSGDVFSAVFAWHWGHAGAEPIQAADLASAATALYCNSRVLPVPATVATEMERLPRLRWNEVSPLPRVYLAGPLFTLPELWLLAECKRCLEEFGLEVFSPKDDVGYVGDAGDSTTVAQEDIKGLVSCQMVFALIDGLDAGTVFEIGYARAKGIPVVLFGELVVDRDLTMMVGNGCELYRDLTTALYRAAWMMRTE